MAPGAQLELPPELIEPVNARSRRWGTARPQQHPAPRAAELVCHGRAIAPAGRDPPPSTPGLLTAQARPCCSPPGPPAMPAPARHTDTDMRAKCFYFLHPASAPGESTQAGRSRRGCTAPARALLQHREGCKPCPVPAGLQRAWLGSCSFRSSAATSLCAQGLQGRASGCFRDSPQGWNRKTVARACSAAPATSLAGSVVSPSRRATAVDARNVIKMT